MTKRKPLPHDPAGRPTGFREEYQVQAQKLCELGATDKDLAGFFGVTEQTINNWKKKHPIFFESLNAGKRLADDAVEAALFKRATGFKKTVQKVDKHADICEVLEEVAPDTTACIFWLKNRRRGQWRDKQELEHQGSIAIIPRIITEEQKKLDE